MGIVRFVERDAGSVNDSIEFSVNRIAAHASEWDVLTPYEIQVNTALRWLMAEHTEHGSSAFVARRKIRTCLVGILADVNLLI